MSKRTLNTRISSLNLDLDVTDAEKVRLERSLRTAREAADRLRSLVDTLEAKSADRRKSKQDKEMRDTIKADRVAMNAARRAGKKAMDAHHAAAKAEDRERNKAARMAYDLLTTNIGEARRADRKLATLAKKAAEVKGRHDADVAAVAASVAARKVERRFRYNGKVVTILMHKDLSDAQRRGDKAAQQQVAKLVALYAA